MPGSKRTFVYSLTPTVEDVPAVAAAARRVLGWACEGDDRITCHEVSGEGLGTVTLTLTIAGRDRWWATQLAQDILNLVTWGVEHRATRLDLESHRQKPHSNRGYQHGRTKRWREPKATAPEDSPPAPQ